MPRLAIASVDYGVHTGLAIADTYLLPSEICLKRAALCTIENNSDEVLRMIRRASCRIVLLERLPSWQPDPVAAASYYYLHDELTRMGYQENKGKRLLVLLSPGVWKPFVRVNQVDKSAWAPGSKHEVDAMGMLYYYLRTHYQNAQKEIRYA